MKLGELARRGGVTTTTLKHWIRVGIVPPGALRNQTTAVYDERHLDRVLLVKLLRYEHGASISEIRTLTTLIDDESSTTLDVMNACQAFALGTPAEVETDPAYEPFRERTYELMRRRDWRGYPGAAERGLVHALAFAASAGLDYDVDELMEYADALEPIATRNVAALGPTGSADQIARRMLMAISARARQLVAINGLAHAAASIRAAIDRGDAPPWLAMPPPPKEKADA
ncbi:MerR family transcriptional regulator [Microbacterium sp.]|uniref:MerR family transcriptional regulator n=1 Tax=Microbacterium sp. TaxID=51671 RepID=UPI0028123930|nr:MerR family transcriptional regulator [Microbacterium sp.]